jgi:hypothetical protein
MEGPCQRVEGRRESDSRVEDDGILVISGEAASSIVGVAQGLLDVVKKDGKLRRVVFADFDGRLLEGGSVDNVGQVQMFTPDIAQTREMDYVRVGREDGFDEQLGDGHAVGLLGQLKETPGHGCVKTKPLQLLDDRGRCEADMAKTRRRTT